MTDKQFVDTLKNIKSMCESTRCKDCKFNIDDDCQIYDISRKLNDYPKQWKMEEIERISQ